MKTSWSFVALAICAVLGGASALHAQDAKPAGLWVNISKGLAAVAGSVKEPGVTAVNVDPATGDLYVGYGHAGIWKSTDHGQKWELVDGGKYVTMGVNSYSCDADPEGKRLVFWGMYGPSLLTLDSGKTWSAFNYHRDWGSTDWSDPDAKTMWICPHGGGNSISFDAGKSWNNKAADKVTALGVFDAKNFAALLVDAIFTSTDGGTTFTKKTVKVAPAAETGMKVYKGVGYWVSPQGILVSKDKGQTWSIQGKPLKDPIAGPFFGADANNMVVVTKESFLETINGGDTWTILAPQLGDAHWDSDKGETTWCRYYAWDSKNNILYGGKLRDSAMMCVLPQRKVTTTAPKEVKAAPAPVDWKEPKTAASSALAALVVWDGDRTFPKAFGYSDPKDKNSFSPQTDEVHQGKVALELRIAASPSTEGGKAVAYGGWNWHGWYPGDSGEDLTKYTHLVFWMKAEKGKKFDSFKVGLTSSTPVADSTKVDAAKYCKNLFDGDWHEVAIPAGDLIVEGAKFNPQKVWALTIDCRTETSQIPYSVFFDDIAFEKREGANSTTKP